ncbi:hypothetical protein ZTR_07304 [Talaromyces verruculosus]|nr:hypothetical protein ZTR_07304 [Talaromyces verruculosus]
MSESRAAPAGFSLDLAGRAAKPSGQQPSSTDQELPPISVLGNGAGRHILNVCDGEKIDSQAVLRDSTRATADPSKAWSQRKPSPSAQTLPVVAPAPSRSASLRRSPTLGESDRSHCPDPVDKAGYDISGLLFTPHKLTLDYPYNVLAATKRTALHRDSCNSPVDKLIDEGRGPSPKLFAIRNNHDGSGYLTDNSDAVSASPDGIFSHPGAEHPGFWRGAVGQPRWNLQTGLDGCYLRRSSRVPVKSPSAASGSKQLGSESEDSESAYDTADEHHHSGDDRWQFRRIVARRMDPSGRRMALVEWENTWEPEEELGGLKRVLRRYARERQAKQVPATETCLKRGGRKRKCP